MKVAIVYAKFGPYHQVRLEEAGKWAQRLGHELHGIEVAGTQADYFWANIPEPGRQYRRHRLYPDEDYWRLTYRAIRRRLRAELDQIRPDALVLPGWGFKESIAGLAWALHHGVPTVLVTDSRRRDASHNPFKTWAKKRLVRAFDAGFAAGSGSSLYLQELGMDPSRIRLGCDVVDNSCFAQPDSVKVPGLVDNGRPRLLSCLRLLPRKNVLFVLDVLATAATPWDWYIAGDGPQKAEVEARILELGLSDRVRLLSYIEEPMLHRIYAACDVYLQPSLQETWGLAINEAMAAGRPILISDRCGCLEDLLQPGVNGYAFDPEDPDSLAERLSQMIRERPRWTDMGKASQSIIADWDLDRYANALFDATQVAQTPAPRGPGGRMMRRVLSRVL